VAQQGVAQVADGLLWTPETVGAAAVDDLVAAAGRGSLPGWTAPVADRDVHLALISPQLPGWTPWRPVAITRSGPDLTVRIVASVQLEWDQTPQRHRHAWTCTLGTLPAGDYHLTLQVEGMEQRGPLAIPRSDRACAAGAFTVRASAPADAPPATVAWDASALNGVVERSPGPGVYWQEPHPAWRVLAAGLVAAHPPGLIDVVPGDQGALAATQPPGQATTLPAAAPVGDGDALALIRAPHDDGDPSTRVARVTWLDQAATIDVEVWRWTGPILQRAPWDGTVPLLMVPLTRPPATGPGPRPPLTVTVRWHHYANADDGHGYLEAPVPADWLPRTAWPAPR
jgi:hypothetical protein